MTTEVAFTVSMAEIGIASAEDIAKPPKMRAVAIMDNLMSIVLYLLFVSLRPIVRRYRMNDG